MEPLTLLQSIPEPLDTQFGRLLIALLVVAVIVVVGRAVLSLAWKLLWIAIVVVGALFGLSILGVV
ncbi:hypothetical protein L593_08820 [Salinarchaeum sp. Harcht-Bsk1]|uniref:hypothetical protein n=1 Tax=Salinarchaeum sp. Harcht-Bsk1 TaxID=1333523 RepID=UPI0003423F69|nr:hypothetical protein [Salinarchaeum sp. Harcht-Bsk1]AGN01709.1 hypothetical protein L593_08820 [Salinarchaeum sp. Harcht-Bsk1]